MGGGAASKVLLSSDGELIEAETFVGFPYVSAVLRKTASIDRQVIHRLTNGA
jgi:hypothetical protein